MQVIPAVDVLDGRVVRLLRGEYDQSTVYGDDPLDALAAWAAQGAPLIHVVDLDGARTGGSDAALLQSLASTDVPFQLGGGIRTTSHAVDVIEAGAQRVVMGTTAVWDPKMLSQTVVELGADRVVAALDVKGVRATGAGWLDEGRPLPEVVADVVGAGVTTVLVTGISKDGTMAGPDLDVLQVVRSTGPDLELIGSGGVGSLADLVALSAHGAAAAIVGRALYEGVFTYREAVAAVAV